MVLLGACSSGFEGESYERVVSSLEVKVEDSLPDGYRIIGSVFSETENVINGNSIAERALWCGVDNRMLRRMKRQAARNGGELLIEFECFHDESHDTSSEHDDPDTNRVETELTCSTACYADVARAWAHDQ